MAAEASEYQFSIEGDRNETPMFNSKLWQLGPEMETRTLDPTSSRPYVAHARLAPGQEAASAAHAGWSLVCILEGSATIDGVVFSKGDMSINEPWSESGVVVAGPEGLTELAVYESGAAAVPYFTDPDDPRVGALMADMIAKGNEFPLAESPRSGLIGKRHKTTLDAGRFTTPYFDANMWNVGPLGHITEPMPIPPDVEISQTPFLAHTRVPAEADVWPSHRHEGWAFLFILDGWYESGDYRMTPGEIWLTSPSHVFDKGLRPGPHGVEEIAIFDIGRCVTPIVLDNSDEHAAAFRDVLKLQ